MANRHDIHNIVVHGIASSYLEGCNFLTVAVSTPADSMGHSLLFFGDQKQWNLTPVPVVGSLTRSVCVNWFMLRQFEIAG